MLQGSLGQTHHPLTVFLCWRNKWAQRGSVTHPVLSALGQDRYHDVPASESAGFWSATRLVELCLCVCCLIFSLTRNLKHTHTHVYCWERPQRLLPPLPPLSCRSSGQRPGRLSATLQGGHSTAGHGTRDDGFWASRVAQWQRVCLQCRSRGKHALSPWSGEDAPEKGKALHSSIVAWRIPWTEELAGFTP